MKRHLVYIARCSDKSLYTGCTHNIEQRIKKHNDGEACQYTKYRRPIEVIHTEEYDTLLEARRREHQIKGWTRQKKENLVKYGHPTKY